MIKIEEKRGNLILTVILITLMIVAIAIVIINPNKIKKTEEVIPKVEQDNVKEEEIDNINLINAEEEKRVSMQDGGKFCKIGKQIVFYEDKSKSIYLFNIDENSSKKIITLEHELNKMYFDGENIYYLPSYYSAKGIYKLDLQGNVQKICDDSSLQLFVTENEIYFVKQIGYDDFNHNPQGNICKMDKQGQNVVELAQNIKNYFYINNDKIYYTTQDRKMYAIDKDGNNQKELVQGRKFVIEVFDKCLLYIDYSTQEAEHILNLETNEDTIIGHYGQLRKYQGKTYINARKRLDDGSIDTEYTLFEIVEDGKIKEIGKITNLGTDLRYISKGKAYIYNQQEGMYIINLEDNQRETAENYTGCRFFLGGYGYKIDDTNLEDIKIEMIEL